MRTLVAGPRRRDGFTLLEVIIAVAILSVGAIGAMMGMLAAARDLRAGQTRLHQQVLVDASLQRARLFNKAALYATAVDVALAGDMPSMQGVGGAAWHVDPSAPAPGDLSVGALFVMLPNGTFAPCNATSTPACAAAPPASCLDAAIPVGVFCREVAVTRTGASYPAPASIASAYASTKWVRVVQRQPLPADTKAGAVLGREVFAQ